MQTLMADDSFQHILRVLNTNVGEAAVPREWCCSLHTGKTVRS